MRPTSAVASRALLAAATTLAFVTVASTPERAVGATVTMPDMTIRVPTNLISIGIDPGNGHKQLRYTHITSDVGTGPLEIDPTYNAATGVSTFTQALYSSPSAGVWQFDHSVPVAQTGVFEPPSDYMFPLTSFTLNVRNPDGSLGAVVATSPKTDYCMTGDVKLSGIANTPSSTYPPASNCTDPTRPLGMSVGWGDQYDQTDSGQPIDLNGVADGDYVLHAIVDPRHVLTESDNTNDVTDTVLTIAGNTLTVGAQTTPTAVPPAATMTSPADGATVSGTVTLSATASAVAPATVSSVQFLLDGASLGTPVTTAPYTMPWTVGSTPAGAHTLSARVTASDGAMGTATPITVTVPPPSGGGGGGFGVDKTVVKQGRGTQTTSAFSTSGPGEVLLAFVGSDGPAAVTSQSVTVSGAGLSWRRVSQANARYGDSEIWTATAASTLTNVTITSTQTSTNFDQMLTVVAFTGAAGVGTAAHASATSGAPNVTLTATAAGSLSYAVGNDWDTATPRTLAAGQTLVSQLGRHRHRRHLLGAGLGRRELGAWCRRTARRQRPHERPVEPRRRGGGPQRRQPVALADVAVSVVISVDVALTLDVTLTLDVAVPIAVDNNDTDTAAGPDAADGEHHQPAAEPDRLGNADGRGQRD